jgi:hypothetical protein
VEATPACTWDSDKTLKTIAREDHCQLAQPVLGWTELHPGTPGTRLKQLNRMPDGVVGRGAGDLESAVGVDSDSEGAERVV